VYVASTPNTRSQRASPPHIASQAIRTGRSDANPLTPAF